MTAVTIDYNDNKLHKIVQVAGEFNDWTLLDLSLTDPESAISVNGHSKSTEYAVSVEGLKQGHSYMYKFIVDDTWLLASDGRPISKSFSSNFC